jgi:protein SCO1/2
MSAPAPPDPAPALAEPKRGSDRAKLLAVAGAALLLTIGPLGVRSLLPGPALPVYGPVPPFHLVDERGSLFGLEALRGHVTVVDFVFTKCTSSCPRLTAHMGELQARLEGDKNEAHLVSISVDPENDTPPVLAEYAARAHASPERWSFLTGPTDEVERVVVSGFKVSAAKQSRGANDYDVIHGDWFVLVDKRAQIRGYFSTTEPKELDHLTQEIARLERER